MNSKNKLVIALLIAIMILVTIYMGNWAVDKNPDGLKLHSPTDEEENEGSSAFGFGASFGLLGTSLLYCLLAVGVYITQKIRKIPPGTMPLAIAIIAAVGFTASYVVDGYFY
jgi:prepilin signal peptidase PulO-like enzyme (type II secretory pathway)